MNRRTCDVCHLIEAEHLQPLGNDCYRRIVAARFPASAPERWTARRSPLEVRTAQERGLALQAAQAGLWKALATPPPPLASTSVGPERRSIRCPYCREEFIGSRPLRDHLRNCGMGLPPGSRR